MACVDLGLVGPTIPQESLLFVEKFIYVRHFTDFQASELKKLTLGQA